MQIQLFYIPVAEQGELLSEMNKFLGTHKVLEVEQKFYQNEKGAYWCFCVRTITGVAQFTGSFNNKVKVDYKQVLTADEFEIFSKLRECRKKIATDDAVPAYDVFTDEELAGIAKLSELTVTSLSTITGIGSKKIEKYGKLIVETINSKTDNNEKGV